MIDNAQLQQLILESTIKAFIFSDTNENVISEDQLDEYFAYLQINDGHYAKKIEKLFMLLFEHIRNHNMNADINKVKELFLLARKDEPEEKVIGIINVYANFLIVYGVEFNKQDLPVDEKLAMLEAIDYSEFLLHDEVNKMYLYSYLDLLLVQPELDFAKITKVTNELKEFLN